MKPNVEEKVRKPKSRYTTEIATRTDLGYRFPNDGRVEA